MTLLSIRKSDPGSDSNLNDRILDHGSRKRVLQCGREFKHADSLVDIDAIDRSVATRSGRLTFSSPVIPTTSRIGPSRLR